VNKNTRTIVIGATCLLVIASSVIGCDRAAEPSRAPAVEPAAPVGLSVPGPGQVFRFIDPGDGAVKTATAVDAIPAPARKQVLVFDAQAPTPAGWEHVVDLSGAHPALTVPTRGFVLRPVVAVLAPGPASKARRSGHEVVMFSTQGCGYCKKARAYFDRHDVAHSEYDVERDAKAGPKLQALAKQAGVPMSQLQGGVPLIFIDGKPHVGFDQGKIAKLLGI
jgi:glutaredoxin 3